MNGEVVHLQHSDIELPLKITITFFLASIIIFITMKYHNYAKHRKCLQFIIMNVVFF